MLLNYCFYFNLQSCIHLPLNHPEFDLELTEWNLGLIFQNMCSLAYEGESFQARALGFPLTYTAVTCLLLFPGYSIPYSSSWIHLNILVLLFTRRIFHQLVCFLTILSQVSSSSLGKDRSTDKLNRCLYTRFPWGHLPTVNIPGRLLWLLGR